jgi:hypothetical protein
MSGDAPRLTMSFNAKGELINLWNPRCHCEQFGTYPLISKSAALDMLKRLDSRNTLVEGIGLNDTFTVNSISLIYYCDPLGYEQKFLVPFYRMEGTNNRGETAVGYVRAVEEKYILVQNPPGFEVYPPEPQRTEFPAGSPDRQTPKPPSDPDVEQNAAKEKR